MKLKTQVKKQNQMNMPKYITMDNRIFLVGCVINAI